MMHQDNTPLDKYDDAMIYCHIEPDADNSIRTMNEPTELYSDADNSLDDFNVTRSIISEDDSYRSLNDLAKSW